MIDFASGAIARFRGGRHRDSAESPRVRAGAPGPLRSLAESRVFRGAVGVLGFFAICQLFTMTARPVSERYLPDPTTVLSALANMLFSGDSEFRTRMLETFAEWGAGMAVASAFAIPVGVLLGGSSVLYRMFRAPLELLRPIPGIALIPLFVLIFGQTFTATMWLVVYVCVWPILLNTIYGVHDVAPMARDTARSYGLGRAAIMLRVSIPSALPLLMTGVRIAASFALIVAVAVEITIGTGVGIGSFINDAYLRGSDMDVVYAATAAAGLMGLCINWSVGCLERWVFPWVIAARGGDA